MDVGQLLTNSATKSPHRLAVVTPDGARITYSELEGRCKRLASAFHRAGLRKGDRLALLFFNSPPFVEAYFAALRLGLVVVPVNFRLAPPEIVFVVNHSRSDALFFGAEFAPTVSSLRGRLDSVRLFVSGRGGISSFAWDYEAFLEAGDGEIPPIRTTEDDPCQIMYTSGTTGRPKGAVITHRNVLWNLFNTIVAREDRPGEVSIIVGPLYHTAALNNHFTIQVALGGTSVLVAKFDPARLLQVIEEHRATVISGSPALYNLLLHHPEAERYDRSSITKCTAGADKLPLETKKRLLEFFPNIRGIYDVYGCTEASPTITVLNETDSLRKNGSVGRPVPFTAVRIVDDGGGVVPPGTVGELVCRGPNVMQEYLDDPEASAAAIREGWLHTGDLAVADEEGFLYIVDRRKDMIVSGGENIYPREIEEALYLHPAILEAAVIGVPDPVWGERVRAFVVTRPGETLDGDEVVEFCRSHLAGYKKPREVFFVPELPRNPSGKVLKTELRSWSPAGDRDGKNAP